MKTRKEIIEYLGIDGEDKKLVNLWLKSAREIERKYKKELASGEYGYGLLCDLDVVGRLEDADYDLIELENINDVIFYKKVLSNESEQLFSTEYVVFVYYDEAGSDLFHVFNYNRLEDAIVKADSCFGRYGRVEILDKFGEKIY